MFGRDSYRSDFRPSSTLKSEMARLQAYALTAEAQCNDLRAADDATGKIRWLRPDYQESRFG